MLNAREACEVAKVHPDRLNEAIARGDFPCAPMTVAGGRRNFDENDFVLLALYGAMTARGVPPRIAGKVACRALAPLENSPDAPTLAIIWRSSGVDGVRLSEVTPDIGYAMGQMRVPKVSEVASGDQDAMQRAWFPIFSVEIVNIAAIRARFLFRVLQKRHEPAPDADEIAENVAEAIAGAFKKALEP